jgi:hypothetical protein
MNFTGNNHHTKSGIKLNKAFILNELGTAVNVVRRLKIAIQRIKEERQIVMI